MKANHFINLAIIGFVLTACAKEERGSEPQKLSNQDASHAMSASSGTSYFFKDVHSAATEDRKTKYQMTPVVPLMINAGLGNSLEFQLEYIAGKTNISIRKFENGKLNSSFSKSYDLPSNPLFHDDPSLILIPNYNKTLRLEDQDDQFIYLSLIGGHTATYGCSFPLRALLKFDLEGNLVRNYSDFLPDSPLTDGFRLKKIAHGFVAIGADCPSANSFGTMFLDDELKRIETDSSLILPLVRPYEDFRIEQKLNKDEYIFSYAGTNASGTTAYVKLFHIDLDLTNRLVTGKEVLFYNNTNLILKFSLIDYTTSFIKFAVNQLQGYYPHADRDFEVYTAVPGNSLKPISQNELTIYEDDCVLKHGENLIQIKPSGSIFEFDQNLKIISHSYFAPPALSGYRAINRFSSCRMTGNSVLMGIELTTDRTQPYSSTTGVWGINL